MPASDKIKIAVLSGGPSSEHDVSLMTAKEVFKNLDRKRYEITKIKIDKKGNWKLGLYKKEPQKILQKADIVFNALHGEFGENGQLQSFLEKAKIPYTGSGPATSALSMDKLASRRIFALSGLSTPKTASFAKKRVLNFKSLEKEVLHKFNLPFVVKPNNLGSSIGVSIVKTLDGIIPAFRNAFKFDEIALAEEFIKGIEVSVPVIEMKGRTLALPPAMIIPESEFFDYHSKYASNKTKEIIPAPLGEDINNKIKRAAILAHKALGLRHYSRTDMILSGNKLYILEINSLPGLTANSLLPKSLLVWGMPISKFLDHIVETTLNKYR